MTIQTYGALRDLENNISKYKHFNEKIKNCLRCRSERDYIKFIKTFDIELQRDILIELQSKYEKQIQKYREEFDRLLKE